MYNNSFFKKILIVATVLFLYSCDKDFNSIGDGLIGDNHFDFNKATYGVVAYNQKISPVQSNNLPVNPLGIYDNPAFGTTTANFVTQVTLASVNPTVGTTAQVESVVLTIPYFSTLKSTDTEGNNTYELDSIYGSGDAKIKLSVYRSGYFMRDLDPATGFLEAQKFYTNQNAVFDNLKVDARLNDDAAVSQNEAFFFDAAEYKETTKATDGVTDVVTRTPPGMRLKLNKEYFQNNIIAAAIAGKLVSNDVFKEYFRGLYFKVEKSGSSPSSMAMMDFKSGKITINYKEDVVSGTTTTKVDKTIVLNLTGNTVSLLEQSNTNADYTNATNAANTTVGDDKLYLKGGEGSMAVLQLFNSGELEYVRNQGWLINEANLVFHIDAATMANSFEPLRIYLYDLNNNRPVVDYGFDSSGANLKNGKVIFGGLLNKEKVTNGRGQTYKIRITNQIRNLVQNADSTNVKLGLVVTEDIRNTEFNVLKTPGNISKVPMSSVMGPLGTVLYGGTAAVADDKRLKLEIYYTKPN
jgi:hypothetical protein